MAPPRRHWAKLKVPSSFLKTLPDFPTPLSKTAAAAAAAAAAASASAAAASAAAAAASAQTESGNSAENTNGESLGNNKINVGLKELSTSGLTMNNANDNYSLDKTGRVRKWVKKSVQFKAFSGFKVTYDKWLPEATKVGPAKETEQPDPEVKVEA